jgi:hypothetical protein
LGTPKRSVGRTSRVAFSFGYFSFGDAKEQVPRLPGRDPACNRGLQNQEHYKNNSKQVNKTAGYQPKILTKRIFRVRNA